MPSQSGAAAREPIDLDHLRKMTLSDPALEREVLRLFVEQTANLMRTLASLPENAAALAHTLKGSARAIGAFRVADAAAALEVALRTEGGAREAFTRLEAEVGQARQAANALLAQSEP
ncbi:MAG: Hpt domain-containing protein [Rhizobiales bacterium]|nr:Hpt domain-containing protein [Hyphomicrobiales bacterium]